MATLDEVRAFWNRASCGEVYAGTGDDRAKYAEVSRARYAFEPYLQPFACFEEAAGKDTLEIGVGMGSTTRCSPWPGRGHSMGST